MSPSFSPSLLSRVLSLLRSGKVLHGAVAISAQASFRQIAVLLNVISTQLPSVLVRGASDGSRPWSFWQQCGGLLFCPLSFPAASPSVLVRSPAVAADLCLLAMMLLTAVLPLLFYLAAISACEKGQQWQQALYVSFLALRRCVALRRFSCDKHCCHVQVASRVSQHHPCDRTGPLFNQGALASRCTHSEHLVGSLLE